MSSVDYQCKRQKYIAVRDMTNSKTTKTKAWTPLKTGAGQDALKWQVVPLSRSPWNLKSHNQFQKGKHHLSRKRHPS